MLIAQYNGKNPKMIRNIINEKYSLLLENTQTHSKLEED